MAVPRGDQSGGHEEGQVSQGSRSRFFTAVLILVVLGQLTHAHPARGQLADATPTWWHEAAGLTPLLTAPSPPNPATICVIDTGVTPTPDLDITARWAYDGGTLDDVRATDESPGHGTLVAHFAAGAVNGWGGAGAFPHARISSVRVFPPEGGASWREYIAAISRCLKLDANTKVILISIGGQEIDPGEADELEAHIERARDRYGVSVVAAAGNRGGPVDFPGRFRAALAVAASSEEGQLCGFSARGEQVDLAAPGCGLTQSGWTGASWAVDGSSFAAPIVAGALAAVRAYVPSLTAREAEMLLLDSGSATAPPVVNASAALTRGGTSLFAPPGNTAVEAASSGTTPRHDDLPASATAARSLPAPLVSARVFGRRVSFVVHNRPRGAVIELALGPRLVRRRASRFAVVTRKRRGRCRYRVGPRITGWTLVRW
jgi:subtilase family protein